jgi:carboxymethylenebutenolidase
MVITTDEEILRVGGSAMRVLVTRPRAEGRWPGVLMYSDIFQITGPQLRVSRRLAGYGFVVATPEIYHRIEPAGTAIPFDDDGRTRGQNDARATAVAEFDADARAVLDFLAAHPRVRADHLGVMGFCLGGHLALRAALQPDVRATASFYPTGVHDGKLGKDADAGTLARLREIRGELLLVFGSRDPHVPEDARGRIVGALRDAGVRHTVELYDAEHAFLRDEGPRWDPEASDEAFSASIAAFRRVFE